MHFVTPLLLSKNIGNDIPDDGFPTDVFNAYETFSLSECKPPC
jgi:hypothetical protein